MSRKRKHHSAEQIVKKLRDAETMLGAGKTVAEVVQVLTTVAHYECWIGDPLVLK